MIKRKKDPLSCSDRQFFIWGGGGGGGGTDTAGESKLIKQTINSVWPPGALLKRSQPLEKDILNFL